MACRCRSRCARASTSSRATSGSSPWNKAMVSATPVGVIGIGLMGEVCARRLLDAGVAVLGTGIDAAKNARLEQMGGRAAPVAVIARECDPIVLCVFSTDQVEDVIE